jgi:hypothetical protein
MRRAFEAFLVGHGYTVVPVTVDNDEFVYAAAYASSLRRGNTAAAMRPAATGSDPVGRLSSPWRKSIEVAQERNGMTV